MLAGIILLGMTLGICGALAALMAGYPVWMMLIAYSGFGSAGVVLAACAAARRTD